MTRRPTPPMVLGLVAATTVGSAAVVPALAATTAARPVSSVAYQKAPKGIASTDTVHTTVSTPVLGRTVVGGVVQVALSTPVGLDCRSVATTFGRTTARPSQVTCTGTRAVVRVKVTSPMVNQRVTVSAWQRTSAASTWVKGAVTIGRTTTSTSAAAKRVVAKPAPKATTTPTPKPTTKPSVPSPSLPPTTPTATPTPKATATPTPQSTATPTPTVQPIGPLTTLGTVGGQTVSVASVNGQNEVWVGTRRFAAPAGTIWHSSVSGTTVDLWQTGTGTLSHWQLVVATGAVTTTTLDGTDTGTGTVPSKVGTPGFWVRVDPPKAESPVDRLYTWTGQLVTSSTYSAQTRSTHVGFTRDYAVERWAGMTPQDVDFVPMNPVGGATISKHLSAPMLSTKSCDDTGCTFVLFGGTTARVEPDKDVVYTQA